MHRCSEILYELNHSGLLFHLHNTFLWSSIRTFPSKYNDCSAAMSQCVIDDGNCRQAIPLIKSAQFDLTFLNPPFNMYTFMQNYLMASNTNSSMSFSSLHVAYLDRMPLTGLLIIASKNSRHRKSVVLPGFVECWTFLWSPHKWTMNSQINNMFFTDIALFYSTVYQPWLSLITLTSECV